jgi:hypothetical protein
MADQASQLPTGIPCGTCGCRMIPGTRFNEDPAGWRARGYRRHGARDQCNCCYLRSKRHAAGPVGPARPPHDRDHVLSEWRRLLAEGEPRGVIAQRLGMTVAALDGVLKRARRDGLIEEGKRGPYAAGRSGRLSGDELARLRRAVGLPTGGVS